MSKERLAASPALWPGVVFIWYRNAPSQAHPEDYIFSFSWLCFGWDLQSSEWVSITWQKKRAAPADTRVQCRVCLSFVLCWSDRPELLSNLENFERPLVAAFAVPVSRQTSSSAWVKMLWGRHRGWKSSSSLIKVYQDKSAGSSLLSWWARKTTSRWMQSLWGLLRFCCHPPSFKWVLPEQSYSRFLLMMWVMTKSKIMKLANHSGRQLQIQCSTDFPNKKLQLYACFYYYATPHQAKHYHERGRLARTFCMYNATYQG